MSEVYAITDIHGYVSQMRETAANSLTESEIDCYIVRSNRFLDNNNYSTIKLILNQSADNNGITTLSSQFNITEDNLDNYISIDQMIGLVKTKCLGFDDNNRPLLDEKTNEDIFEETAVWIHNVGLAKLAAQDLVECAWDNELNDMVFWAKETQKNDKPKRKRKRKRKDSQ